MADWSKPTITSNYITFVDEMKARDADAITLQRAGGAGAGSSVPLGAVWLQRAPVVFTEWDGANYNTLVLSAAGGGTGVTSIGGLRGALGLGSMAYQNSNAIAVTGGTISNIASSISFAHTGAASFTSSAGGNAIIATGVVDQWTLRVHGVTHGLYIAAGTSGPTYAVLIQNRDTTINGLIVYGDMVCAIPYRLVIPVGIDQWAP